MSKKKRDEKKILKEEKKKSIFEGLKKYSEYFTVVVGIVVALYSALNFYYSFQYKLSCEDFYGIPGEYFKPPEVRNSINAKLIYFVCMLVIVGCFLIPYFSRKIEAKNGVKSRGVFLEILFFSTCIGASIGFINVDNLAEILKKSYKNGVFWGTINAIINYGTNFIILFVYFTGICTCVVITLLPEIRKMSEGRMKKIIEIFFVISFSVTFLLFVFGMFAIITTSIDDKTKYEVVTNKDVDLVVLSKFDEMVLVVPYSINKSDDTYLFDTTNYQLINILECKFSYINTNTPPKIKKNV